MRFPFVLLATVAAAARAFRASPPLPARPPPGRAAFPAVRSGPSSTAPLSVQPGRAPAAASCSALSAVLYPVSGVDSLPVLQQQLQFAGAFAGLGFGTAALRATFAAAEEALPDGWFANWRSTWPILGVVYVAAGAAHFAVSDAFLSIYPPPGTWGLWYLPGSPEFQVAWTGIAELAGGIGLLAGAALSLGGDSGSTKNWERLKRTSAGCLAALTLAVTPANFYMYSHGAIMVGAGPDGPMGIEFHAVRFVAQILLLGVLTGIAAPPGGEDPVES